jgi:hypothetical protein
LKRLLLILLLITTLKTNSTPVQELVNIPYPITYTSGYEAYSDGYNIVIGLSLITYIGDINQIGLVILHEAYHNRLNHGYKISNNIKKKCGLTGQSAQICSDNYRVVNYLELQRYEREADMGAFLTGKLIGYTAKDCDVFPKLKLLVGDDTNKYSTHPTLLSRYKMCRSILK